MCESLRSVIIISEVELYVQWDKDRCIKKYGSLHFFMGKFISEKFPY